MTIPKNAPAQNQQDFIRIQDLFYLCLNKWHWFVLSLAVCLGAAVWYLLTTPPVYTRSASILIKDDSKGKSTSGAMEDFADFGMFATSTNVNNEMGTLQSPDLMREVVSRLNLNMDYHTDGRFHRQTVYGEQLPVKTILVDFPANQAAAFTMQLKDGNVTLFDFKKDEESIDGSFTGTLNDTISSPVGKIVIQPDSSYEKEEETLLYVSHVPIQSAVAAYSMNLSVSQNDEKSNIITLTFKDVSTQRAEDVLNTLIAVYNENWVKDKNQIAVSTSMFINDRLGVIEGELGNVDNDISSYKSEHLLPDVQVAASMYMAQANEANASIKELNNQAY
ncbi:MAG: chromosome partitioning protein ParA, partial [Bacteroides sp.]|nr:chromosome partitioning protein ParA [Bacteroides sp.]